MKFQEPVLLMFFSVDLIGSTAFKQKNIQKDNLSSNWKKNFQDFYNNFKIELQQSYQKIEDTLITEKENFYYPYRWKFLGDEIIFVTHIDDFKYIYPHIEAFKKALVDYNVEEKTLKIRFTSWLAEFPIVNTILGDIKANFKKEIYSKTEVDFLGPSIDLGFRIAKYSSERKIVISVDLAFTLLKYCLDNKIKPYYFYFDKEQAAIGLINNKYPIIWIDNFDGENPIEDELYGVSRKECDYDQLFKFCENHINSDKYKIMKPFSDYNQEFKSQKYIDSLYKLYEMNTPLETLGSKEGLDSDISNDSKYNEILSRINKEIN